MCAVPSAPGAAGVRVWEVTSRERGPRTGRPPPEAFMSTILCKSTCPSFRSAEVKRSVALPSAARVVLAL